MNDLGINWSVWMKDLGWNENPYGVSSFGHLPEKTKDKENWNSSEQGSSMIWDRVGNNCDSWIILEWVSYGNNKLFGSFTYEK